MPGFPEPERRPVLHVIWMAEPIGWPQIRGPGRPDDHGHRAESIPNSPDQFPTHPMKGPMSTQTLRGLNHLSAVPFARRRYSFEAFNPAFDTLLGGPQLPTTDMNAYTQFIEPIQFQPNPYRSSIAHYPVNGLAGNPSAGLNTFLNEPYALDVTCNRCHLVNPGPGTNRSIPALFGKSPQAIKVPQFRNQFPKIFLTTHPVLSTLDGFGFTHDGGSPGDFAFLVSNVFPLVTMTPRARPT